MMQYSLADLTVTDYAHHDLAYHHTPDRLVSIDVRRSVDVQEGTETEYTVHINMRDHDDRARTITTVERRVTWTSRGARTTVLASGWSFQALDASELWLRAMAIAITAEVAEALTTDPDSLLVARS